MFDYMAAETALAELRKHKPALLDLEKSVGGLSKPSKMPWYGYSVPASRCHVGKMLRDVPGSVCSKCYAHKGRYVFSKVQAAMELRWALLMQDPALWAARMAALLERKAKGQEQWFRWHDSGDVQGEAHLRAIVWIARQVPHVHFWLPTKETGLLMWNEMRRLVETASNLTVRISAPMVGKISVQACYCSSSVGIPIGEDVDTEDCPAKEQGGKCGDCRACWNRTVPNVNYPLH